MKGKFIVIEGVDFTGKTTQMNKISAFLNSLSINHIVTREPGGTKLGESVRDIVLKVQAEDPAKEATLLLFMASRAENIAKIVLPALLSGRHVICDRFIASTLVYQGVLSGFKWEDILSVHKLFNYNLYPDLTILLDARPNILLERSKNQNTERQNNKYDFLPLETFEKLEQAFIKTSEIKELNTKILNAEEDEEEVFAKIKSFIMAELNIYV
jgi:dTMP kinase